MKLKPISFKIPEDLLKKLDDYASSERVPRSVIIRKAIEYYLTTQSKKNIPKPKIVRLNS